MAPRMPAHVEILEEPYFFAPPYLCAEFHDFAGDGKADEHDEEKRVQTVAWHKQRPCRHQGDHGPVSGQGDQIEQNADAESKQKKRGEENAHELFLRIKP